jgi:hypothetical protein
VFFPNYIHEAGTIDGRYQKLRLIQVLLFMSVLKLLSHIFDDVGTDEYGWAVADNESDGFASGSGLNEVRDRLERLLVPSKRSILRSVPAIYISIPTARS